MSDNKSMTAENSENAYLKIILRYILALLYNFAEFTNTQTLAWLGSL